MADYERLILGEEAGDLLYPLSVGNFTANELEDAEDVKNRFVQIYTLLSLAGLGFVSNILVIGLLYRKCQRKRCVSNIDYLILQLTVADLLVAAFCVLADAIWKITFQWLAGDFMCKAIKFMQMFSLYASTFIIVTISLDRCIAILNPIPKFDHHRIVRIMTLISWTGAAICSIPQLIVFGVRQGPMETAFFQCVTHGFYEKDWHETAYILFTFTVMGAVPLLIITASYAAIFVKLNLKLHQRTLSQNKRLTIINDAAAVYLPTTKETKREMLLRRAMMKSLWISVLVIITFILCWAPYYIAMLYYLIVRDASDKRVQYMSSVIFFFGMTNSVLNPVIYGACHLFRRSQMAWRKRIQASSPGFPRSHTELQRLESCRSSRRSNCATTPSLKPRSKHCTIMAWPAAAAARQADSCPDLTIKE